jgi:hypothetical protein
VSEYSGSYAPRTGGTTVEPSTSDVVRDEAANVGRLSRDAGGQVAQTAADQGRQVAAEAGRQASDLLGEAKEQARDLLGEAKGQARDQVSAQQQKAAQQLRSVADELGELAGKGGESGVAAEFARQAAGRLNGVASWLEQREPADLLDEAREFARRRPGAFLIGAAVAGLAAGRLTRGLTAKDNGQPGTDKPGYPADPGYRAETAYPTGAAPVGGTVPAYPAEPGFLPEPGAVPGAEGPGYR